MHFYRRSAFFFNMKCKQISNFIEKWAPLGAAWQKDNVGLQVGNLDREVTNILLTLDVTSEVISEAQSKSCNLIISHHPLLFYPIKKIDISSCKLSLIIEQLIKNDITLISYHTNLDFTRDGVSFQLAKKIGLEKIEFLAPSNETRKKVIVYVPKNDLDKVASALFEAGGGIIGEYTNCSNQINITGTFLGTENSNPVIGEKGKFEKVDEVRLEVIFDDWNIGKAIRAIKENHPYEEPAFEVFDIVNPHFQYGAGAIGELPAALDENEFVEKIVNDLQLQNLRRTNGKRNKIKKVAVCGGSGSDLLKDAVNAGADAFVTADLKYHTFQEADGNICLIDAGHFETELPVLAEVENRLNQFLQSNNSITNVYVSEEKTNPVKFNNK